MNNLLNNNINDNIIRDYTKKPYYEILSLGYLLEKKYLKYYARLIKKLKRENKNFGTYRYDKFSNNKNDRNIFNSLILYCMKINEDMFVIFQFEYNINHRDIHTLISYNPEMILYNKNHEYVSINKSFNENYNYLINDFKITNEELKFAIKNYKYDIKNFINNGNNNDLNKFLNLVFGKTQKYRKHISNLFKPIMDNFHYDSIYNEYKNIIFLNENIDYEKKVQALSKSELINVIDYNNGKLNKDNKFNNKKNYSSYEYEDDECKLIFYKSLLTYYRKDIYIIYFYKKVDNKYIMQFDENLCYEYFNNFKIFYTLSSMENNKKDFFDNNLANINIEKAIKKFFLIKDKIILIKNNNNIII